MRWHSPPDWTDTEPSNECKDTFDGGDSLSARGQLSSRMRKEGILLYCISVNAVSRWEENNKYQYNTSIYKFIRNDC